MITFEQWQLSEKYVNRRNVLGVITAAGTVAACSGSMPPDISTITKEIEQLIQKVQAGVAQACATVGKLVPTVDTVLLVVETLLGAQITTANLAQAVALVGAAIDAIAKVGCPSGTPQFSPLVVNGTTVPVVFY